MGWRRSVPVVIAGLALAACTPGGDGSSPAPSTVATRAEGSSRMEAAAATIVERWGDRDGFAVVLLAADRGYDVDQILDHPDGLGADGTIEGVEPAGRASGLIGAPPAPAPPGTPAAAPGGDRVELVVARGGFQPESPAEAYVGFVDDTLGELFGEARRHLDELKRNEEAEAAERATFTAYVTFVATGLLARGYSTEQIIEAVALSEWTVDPAPVPCLRISSVTPAGPERNGWCPPVAREEDRVAAREEADRAADGDSADDGADRDGQADDPGDERSGRTTSVPAGGPEPGSGAGPDAPSVDGTYVGEEPLGREGTGQIVEVLDTEISLTVEGGAVRGRVVETVLVRSESGGRTITQRATQTIDIDGTVADDGTIVGQGRTSSAYELVSCEPVAACSGVTATKPSKDEVAVTLSGTVGNGTLQGAWVNSVSGVRTIFEARRTR